MPDRKPTILIADDIPANLAVLFELLSAQGFELSVAEDGESALQQADYVRPDLILLDVMMPEMDGFTTCQLLKARPTTQAIPVIFMTARTDTVDKVKGLSSRQDRIMVKLNCATIPENLVESELFGHEKGAFTGALTRKLGRFELADQGTLFLDEVGELPLDLQAKLLRVLQEGEFERVGGMHTLKVDVRIIAATNRDLAKSAREGTFRPDLFYRLNVFPIALPPLRARKEDLPLLIYHFARGYAKKYAKRIDTVPRSVMIALLAYDWPGNVRELQHMLERAVILTRGTDLVLEEDALVADDQPLPSRIETLEEMERAHILKVLEATGWRVAGKAGAAELLGLPPSTLESRMKKLGIMRPA